MVDVLNDSPTFHPIARPDQPDWMNEYFFNIKEVLDNLKLLTSEPLHVEPFRKYDGLIVFADGTDWNPGYGRGIYHWDSNEGVSGEWVFTTTPMSDLVAKGYGGARQGGTPALANMGAGFQTLPATEELLTNPVGVTQDPVNDGVRPLYAGVWQVSIAFSLAHADSNSGRTYQVRLHNVTDAISGNTVPVFVGRNQDGSNFSATIMFEVAAASVGDLLVVQIGGGDAFTGVVLTGYQFSINHLSEVIRT